jgi:hydroxyethylthiazole kinase-like sugar kinase family protein
MSALHTALLSLLYALVLPVGLIHMGDRLAAELAAKEAKGPGSLRAGLLDHLYAMDESIVVRGIRIH